MQTWIFLIKNRALDSLSPVPFSSPIDLSTQTRNTRYCLLRNGPMPSWVVGYEECRPDYRIERPRGFTACTLEFILSGEGHAETTKHSFPLKPGTFFVYHPGEPIAFWANGVPMTKYFLSALSVARWKRSWFGQIPAGEARIVPGQPAGSFLLERILAPGSVPGCDREAAAESMLEGFGAWLIASGRSPAQGRPPDLVERAFALLESHFKELPSVASWAERLDVSQSHLCRVFKNHHHKTPYAELTDRKLQHAYRLLSQSTMTIQEAAFEVGYSDPFHFSRLFKRRLGFPPSHAR